MDDKEKPRLSRLTAIITQLLQSKRIVTATYLAKKHGDGKPGKQIMQGIVFEIVLGVANVYGVVSSLV